MLKKLTAKVQQLNTALPENSSSFAKCLLIDPGSPELVLKKGTIYAVFEIEGSANFEVNLITNVVHDVMHNSYYQSDNISPIQSLEKAITQVKDKVTQMVNESVIIEKQSAEFKIVAGVLWGNVMYVVQYGEARSFLMRGGEVRPINTASEGSFSSASGVVKDDDVIILCSRHFADNYPPDKLLSVSIPETQLNLNEAGMLIKFVIDTDFTQNEVVDFGLEETDGTASAKPNFISTLLTRIKSKLPVKPRYSKLSALPQNVLTDTPAKTATIRRDVFSKNIKLKTPANIKIKPVFLVPVIALALVVSIFLTLKNKGAKTGGVTAPAQENTASQQPSAGEPGGTGNLPAEEPKPEEPAPKEEPETQVFYDLSITDPLANPTQIAVFQDYVALSDKNTGKIYVSEIETPKFTAKEQTYPGISNLINIKGNLGFTDNEGYKVYNLKTFSLAEDYKTTELGVTSAYSDYLYSIKDDILTRYTKSVSALSGVTWGQNAVFKETRAFSISYSIYFLLNDGTVKKFTSGEENSFSLNGDSKKITDAIKLVTDIDMENIYIADKGNQRVAVYTKDGDFVREYVPAKEGRWSDIKSIGVSPDEKMLYVLTGTRVYEISL